MVSDLKTESIALQTLPWHERQPSLLFRLKGVRQRSPTGLLIDAHRIKNSDPVKTSMAKAMTQTLCTLATDCIAMAAHHGRTTAMTQHQPLAFPLIHANQVVAELITNLRTRQQTKQQHRQAKPAR